MPADPHPDDALALAAAGALPPDERAPLAGHLSRCARCRTELAVLRELTAALAEENALVTPPPQLADRVVRAVARERSRGRRRGLAQRWLAAAAAAIALLGVGSLLPRAFDAPQERIELVAVSDGVQVQGALVAHTWGTELQMTIVGLPAGQAYDVVLVDRAGVRYDAGAFLGVAGRPVVCRMNAAVLRPDVVRVVVENREGKTVVQADV